MTPFPVQLTVWRGSSPHTGKLYLNVVQITPWAREAHETVQLQW